MPPKDKILNLVLSVGDGITGHLDWLHLVTIVEGFLAVGAASALKE
jgi:hypothetical protein